MSATSLKSVYPRKLADVVKKNWVSQFRLLLEDLNLTDIFINAANKKGTLATQNLGVPQIEVFFIGGSLGSGVWRHWDLKVEVNWLFTSS